jgi:hypothetical protein
MMRAGKTSIQVWSLGIGEGTMLKPIESPSPPRSGEKVPKADEGASYHSGKRQDRHL